MYKIILAFITAVSVNSGFAQTPSLEFDQKEVKFGASGAGIQTCQYLTVKNTTDQPQVVIGLQTSNPAQFSIPSPTQEMLPITIRRGGTMTMSICFTPDKVGDFKTELSLRTGKEVVKLPISGKGIKPEDVARLPKTEITISAPKKKKKDWIIGLKLPKSSKLVLQLLDPLGTTVKTYVNNEIMNEGNYEFAFNGTDAAGKKVEAGSYYVRMTGAEMYTNKEIKISKMFAYKP